MVGFLDRIRESLSRHSISDSIDEGHSDEYRGGETRISITEPDTEPSTQTLATNAPDNLSPSRREQMNEMDETPSASNRLKPLRVNPTAPKRRALTLTDLIERTQEQNDSANQTPRGSAVHSHETDRYQVMKVFVTLTVLGMLGAGILISGHGSNISMLLLLMLVILMVVLLLRGGLLK